jgi:hypothetical protein
MKKQQHKGGRPTLPQARRRSKSVTVKFSKIDYETLRIRSRKANKRLAEYIRETALQTEMPTAHTTVDAGVFRNLAGVANNLNQLTKLSHQMSLYRTNFRLKEVLDRVMEIVNDYRQEKEKGKTA